MEGKFTFADQRVIALMGYAPQELLGKSCFDLIHHEDQAHMKDSFEQVVKAKGQSMNFMYRFRHKTGEWVWLRTSAFAFLNPYTDEIEYVVCTNSTAKTGSGAAAAAAAAAAASSLGDVAAAAAAAATNTSSEQQYRHTPSSGLDYSMQQQQQQQQSRTDSLYSQQSGGGGGGGTAPAAPPPQSTPVYSYDQTSSPAAAYGSPGSSASNQGNQQAVQPRAPSVGKNSGTPTPPQSAWTQPTTPAAVPISDSAASSYHYASNLSPSRVSPGSSAAAAASSYRAASAAAAMWHWQQQGNGQASGLELGHPSALHPHHAAQAAAAAPHAPHAPPPGHHELGDMLHMLGHHGAPSAATAPVTTGAPPPPHHSHAAAAAAAAGHHHGHHGFENLGMFTGQYQ